MERTNEKFKILPLRVACRRQIHTTSLARSAQTQSNIQSFFLFCLMMLIIRISSGGEVTVLFTCLLHVWAGKLEIAKGSEILAECPMSLEK